MAGVGVVIIVRDRSTTESAARWTLAVVTVILMASMGGGFLLLPVLIPAHVWAARRSGRAGRLGWSLLPALSVAMVTWVGVYVAVGESQPVIWLLPVAALVAAWLVIDRLAGTRPVATVA
jgi:hypothetical protein